MVDSLEVSNYPSPAPAHVHCVAAILWYSHDMPVTYNLHGIVSKGVTEVSGHRL